MRDLKKIDKTLLIILIVYSILGLVMIFSSSSVSAILRYHRPSNYFFIKQLIAYVIAYVIGFIILFIPTKNYKILAYLATAGIIFLLVLVLVIGKFTNNALSWFKIGPFSIQPSEFAKTVLIVFMAVFYNYLQNTKQKNLSLYFIPMAIALIMVFLIIKQPDLGSALILLAIAGLTFLSVPMVRKNFKKILRIGLGAVLIVAVLLLYKGDAIFTKDKLSRFNFRSPCTRYQEETGYQVCNGLIAISNGGLFGKGLGQSTQKYMYLPESHTDFIYPIIVEELGAIVGVLIIIGYGILLTKLFHIAKTSENLRNSLIAYGAFWYFTTHILINMLGILALIPLTGVPLPFLSYGGSYGMNSVIIIFIVERVVIENKKLKLSREIANL